MKPTIDFLLHESFPDGRVTGRNCLGDVQLGAIFTGLYRRDFPATEPGESIVSPEPMFVCELALRLDAIEMYGRSMDFVAHGYTAMLSLSGSGFSKLSDFLSGAQERTYFSICASDEPMRPNRKL